MSALSSPSLFQYYNDKVDADGTPLLWPGGPGGLPFRGKSPGTVSQEEYERLQLSGVVRVSVFHTANEDDMKRYCDIRGRALNGMYVILDRGVRWDEERKCERIFLEWAEMAYGMSRGAQNTLPMEGYANAVTGPYAVPRRVFDPSSGIPPGMQLEQGRGDF